MESLHIIATGKYVPEKVVTNDDLAKIVETDNEWIVSRTGIEERRINETLTNAEMGARAGAIALERSGIDPNDLYCLVFATYTPDTFSPATACKTHELLGLPEHVVSFDLNDACPGFLMGLHVARGLLMQNPGKKALVIASEWNSDFTDWTDRQTCVLFGDGAGAAVVDLESEAPIYFTGGTKRGFEAIQVSTTPRAGADHHVIRMNGKDVFRFAVKAMQDAIEDLLAQSGLALDDIDHFICHQANLRILRHVQGKMGIPEEKFFLNVQRYGNTSAASSAIALAEANEQGRLKRGDKIIFVCFGAGLVWEGILLEW